MQVTTKTVEEAMIVFQDKINQNARMLNFAGVIAEKKNALKSS